MVLLALLSLFGGGGGNGDSSIACLILALSIAAGAAAGWLTIYLAGGRVEAPTLAGALAGLVTALLGTVGSRLSLTIRLNLPFWDPGWSILALAIMGVPAAVAGAMASRSADSRLGHVEQRMRMARIVAVAAWPVGLVLLIVSLLISRSASSASSYGITKSDKAALVVINDSGFDIIEVTLDGRSLYDQKEGVLAEKGGQDVFEISARQHSLKLRYYAEWYPFYVDEYASASFTANKGRAVRVKLSGGRIDANRWYPPELEIQP
jgi:hypothetical protein